MITITLLLNSFFVLDECWVQKKIHFFETRTDIQESQKPYYTDRDYFPYYPDRDVAGRLYDVVFSSPEDCFWCEPDKVYTHEEKQEIFDEMLVAFMRYYWIAFKERIQCPVKNDYFFPYF